MAPFSAIESNNLVHIYRDNGFSPFFGLNFVQKTRINILAEMEF
jgi:hypothetical protein